MHGVTAPEAGSEHIYIQPCSHRASVSSMSSSGSGSHRQNAAPKRSHRSPERPPGGKSRRTLIESACTACQKRKSRVSLNVRQIYLKRADDSLVRWTTVSLDNPHENQVVEICTHANKTGRRVRVVKHYERPVVTMLRKARADGPRSVAEIARLKENATKHGM